MSQYQKMNRPSKALWSVGKTDVNKEKLTGNLQRKLGPDVKEGKDLEEK